MSEQIEINARTVAELRDALQDLTARGLGDLVVEYIDHDGRTAAFDQCAIYYHGPSRARVVQFSGGPL